jgi:hypothetical protein
VSMPLKNSSLSTMVSDTSAPCLSKDSTMVDSSWPTTLPASVKKLSLNLAN